MATPPPKRKAKKSLPAENFPDILDIVGGSQVTILVGPEKTKFEFPKALLCRYSKYFDRCFNGEFVEGRTQVLELDEDNPEAFRLLMGWIFTGKVELPGIPLPADKAAKARTERVTSYISILTLADKLDIQGPIQTITFQIQSIFKEDRQALLGSHIRSAAMLPDNHPLRKLIAAAAVRPFLRRNITARYRGDPFIFEREKNEVEGFARDLLDAVSETLVHDNMRVELVGDGSRDPHRKRHVLGHIFVLDPIFGDKFCPWPSEVV